MFRLLLIALLITPCVDAAPRKLRKSSIKPIILIPGNCGSQIELKIDRQPGWEGDDEATQGSVPPGCGNQRDWFRAWLNVKELLPENIDCWLSYIKLDYNSTERRSRNTLGVTSRVPGFGSTDTIEYIDPSWSTYILGNIGAQFAPFVKELKSWGYEKGKSLFGAPYDFRFAPHSLAEYYADLKALVEKAYSRNKGRRVMLLAHSQGGLVTLYFLRQQSQEWKDKHIEGFMSIGTPWGGAGIVLSLYTSGYNSGVELIDALRFRDQQRKQESSAFMLPRPPAYTADEPLVVTPGKNYSASMYREMYEDMGFPLGVELMENVQGEDYALKHPGVNMFCWHGSGFDTPEMLEFDEGFPDAEPRKIHKVNGDEIISRRSLRACQHFMNDPAHVNSLREFRGGQHLHMFTHKVFRNQLKRVLLGKHSDLKKDFDFSGKNKYRFFRMHRK